MFSERMKFYIIYGENSEKLRYYIANTNPVIWNQDLQCAKRYMTSKNAEYDVVGDYYNYRNIKRQIDNYNILNIYVAEYDTDLNEIRRINII